MKAMLYSIETAKQLRDTLMDLFPLCDVLLMAAAVSDFKPANQLAQKEKKGKANRQLELVPTHDSLLELSRQKEDQVLVGFAAETENLEEHGMLKLREKNLDWIAVNRVGPEIGFQSDHNEILLLGANGSRLKLGPSLKSDLADQLLDMLAIDPACRAIRP